MRDYRDKAYRSFYKHLGFFVLVGGVFLIAFKVTAWAMWARECINASL